MLNPRDEELFVLFGNSDYSHGTLDGMSVYEPEDIPALKPTLSNFPNPFNPSTEVRFTAKNAEDAKIEIYNLKGQKIVTLSAPMESECIEGRQADGYHSVTWHGTDQNNHAVASGVYYYTLKLDGKIEASRKMVLLK